VGFSRGGPGGRRNDCARCPVALFLGATFGRDSIVDVGTDSVTVTREMWVDQGYEMGYSEQQTVVARLPTPVRAWIREFDKTTRYGFLEAA
jgi:hypothetical protein